MRAIVLTCALIIFIALSLSTGLARPAGATSPPHHDDALVAPPPSSAALAALASTTDARGPSQFMAGDVALLLVLPESNGAIDPSTENWTPEGIAAVRAAVQEGADWWARQLPRAGLRFHLRVQVVPTDYEPTRYGLANEGLWMSDTLRRLGFSGASYFDQAYAAAAAVRDELGADWGSVLFVPNSANGNGTLADGRFAYAYINGPMLVITSDAGGYGIDDMPAVVAHELGHTFGALDHYAAARITCDRRSGYLDTPTTNSQYGGCGTRHPSIMLDATGAFAAGAIDPSALHQLGYRDSDGDGVIDPLDTAPALELQEQRLASSTGRPTLRGSTSEVAFPSAFQPDVSINTIRAVEYRVDGGLWLPTEPTDGAFDSPSEEFAAELPLYDGSYSVEIRAVNSLGATSPVVARPVTVTWIGPAPRYALSAPKLAASNVVQLQLQAPAATAAVQVSESADFAGAPWQPYTPEISYTLSPGEGRRSLYVRFRDQFHLVSLPLLAEVVLDTQPPRGAATRPPTEPGLVLLSATDASTTVTDVEVTVGAETPRWLPYASSVELPEATADQTISVRFRDAAGNVSPLTPAAIGYRVALPLVRQ